ncbi:hypothetical protein [Marinigracilibium pacificum]|uniref:Lipase maturation factor family protein n=1 Tax=Marinigracilibium pacificum TaxID=2729599 RepID=A0A848IVH5_9BACT|nr:hypothetical protein [Marinigracilibium pacificum]NMM47241.1 lipase maturation factor family protein [Marinigracilibium pacificum]
MSIRKSIETEKLMVFSMLWALTVLSNLIIFDDWIKETHILGYSLLLFCIALLIRPISKLIFIAAVVNSLVYSFQKMPYIPNQMMFEWLINIPILLYLLISFFKENPNSVNSDKLFIWMIEPVAQWGLLILYFFMFFHKLNTGFLDIDYSCGIFRLDGLTDRINQIIGLKSFEGISSSSKSLNYVSIYGTLFMEAIIPVFLFTRRFRTTGIFIGMIYHYILSLHPNIGIFSFSLIIFTYYIFFLPDSFFIWIRSFRNRNINLILRIILFSLIGIFYISYYFFGYWKYYITGQILWYILGFAFIIIYLVFLRSINKIYESELFKIEFPGFAGLIFLFFIMLNGLSPYLGLKTETSFAMFSNLKTEDGSNNHLIVPDWLQVFNFQKNLVKITDSNMKYVSLDYYPEGSERLFTDFELQRVINFMEPGSTITFTVDDNSYTIKKKSDGSLTNTDRVKSYSYFTYKFLLFRPYYKEDINFCQH